jgi:patched 1 protein
VALYARAVVQKALFGLGSLVQRQAMTVLLVVLIAFTLCCYGLQFVRIENDIVKLWVPRKSPLSVSLNNASIVEEGGILDEELNFLSRIQAASNSSSSDSPPRENGIGGGYQVLIQTQTQPEENIASREGLLRHVALIQEIADYTVFLHDRYWFLLLAIRPLQELDPVGHLLQTPGTGACQ